MDNESELYQETAGAAEETSAAEEAPVKKNAEFFRVVKFVLFSASAGLIEISSFALLNETLHWPYWLSYMIALVLSVLWNFTLNRKFTFKSAANVPVAMLKVAAYYAVFTPLTSWLEHVYTAQWGWNEYIATGVNMALNLITEFLYQRFFVFGSSLDTQEKKS
ncbi:MAG: GtrA family protein [Lachnospiraceae bacterium]|nr:GtrA family protein [Lachnospiraceae bacterium]